MADRNSFRFFILFKFAMTLCSYLFIAAMVFYLHFSAMLRMKRNDLDGASASIGRRDFFFCPPPGKSPFYTAPDSVCYPTAIVA